MRSSTLRFVSFTTAALAPFFAASALGSLAGCGPDAPPAVAPMTTSTATAPAVMAAPKVWSAGGTGIDEAAMDPSVDACTDFYDYACGGWIKATTIPDDQSRWFRSFDVIFEQNETRLKATLEADQAGKGGDSAYAKQLGDFYASCMDEAAIEKAGTAPLKPYLAEVTKVHDAASLTKAVAWFHARGIGMFFGFDAGQDFKDATQEIGILSQGGLGLPDRDYYLKDDAKTKDIQAKYVEHLTRMFGLLGEPAPKAKADAETTMRVETALAKASMSKVDRRDPQKTYHKMDQAGVAKLAPTFGWAEYFKEQGQPQIAAINVEEPDFFSAAFASSQLDGKWADVQTYMRSHVARGLSSFLPKKFVDESFKMKSVLTGTAKILPRWKRCVRQVDGEMGEALAQPFVKETLGAEGKAQTQKMIGEIEDSMRGDIGRLDWMDATTRQAALDKLSKINNKVGYPDKWRNYDGLTIDRAKYLDSVINGSAFEVKREMAKIGKQVDRGEWGMTPPTVNAYYDPSMNEMVFPAGILQKPFYSVDMKPWVAFGGIGLVMGHELTHGFDDEGRQFDGDGNLRDWWSPSVGKEFDKRADCVKTQYDNYTVLDGVHLDGKLTLGENLADLGGAKLAYLSMERATAGTVDAPGKFSKEQQYFLGFAQGWCGRIRDEQLRLQVATNPHSPANFRVNGPLSNMPEFASAFSCNEGAPMARPAKDRCQVW